MLASQMLQSASVLDQQLPFVGKVSDPSYNALKATSLDMRSVAHDLNKWADILGHGAK